MTEKTSSLIARQSGRLREIYQHHFDDPRRERMFISSLSFFASFAATRAVTHAIRHHIGPFRNLSHGGTHIHHAVWGILSLIGVGYLWADRIGTADGEVKASRATSALYGFGSALTLDEFALWLNLKDVYWQKQGRQSIDAVVLFGGLLSVAWWGGAFVRDAGRELSKVLQR